MYRGDALDSPEKDPDEAQLISTIIAVVPGIAFSDVKAQLVAENGDEKLKGWENWCSLDAGTRKQRRIAYCFGPDDRLLSSPETSTARQGGLPCTALAHVVGNACVEGVSTHHPEFPQGSYWFATLHNTYVDYAAYFDLGRHQVRAAVCDLWGSVAAMRDAARPSKCAMRESDSGSR